MYWKIIDKISGIIYENHYKFKINELSKELIDDYKKQNITAMCQYIGNGIYILVTY